MFVCGVFFVWFWFICLCFIMQLKLEFSKVSFKLNKNPHLPVLLKVALKFICLKHGGFSL